MTTSGLQQFDTRENVRLEVRTSGQSTAAAPINLCPNPDGATGCWGWRLSPPGTNGAGTQLMPAWDSGIGSSIKVSSSNGGSAGAESLFVPMSAGEYVAGQFMVGTAKATATGSKIISAWWNFYSSTYTLLSGTAWSSGTALTLTAGTNTYNTIVSGPATVAPAGTAFVTLVVQIQAFPSVPAGDYFTLTGVNMFRTATNLGTVSASYRPPVYVNVLDSCTDISIKRGTPSTLTAHLSGSTYDPATSSVLAKGTPIRATAYDATSSTWESLFTGTISDAVADYYTLNNNPAKIYTTVTLTASDPAAPLANTPTSLGATNIANGLPYLLTGQSFPWLCEGWAGTFPAAAGITTPAKGSLLDAVGVARDTVAIAANAPRFAWIDRTGMLRVPFSSAPGIESGTQVLGTFPSSTNCSTSWSGSTLTMTATAAGNMTAYAANRIDVIPGRDYTFTATAGANASPKSVSLSITWLSLDQVTQVAAAVTVGSVTESTSGTVAISGTLTAPANAYGLTYTLTVSSATAGSSHTFSAISAGLTPVQFGDTTSYAPAVGLDSYSAIDIGYSTASLINQVTITDGTTTWGPYSDQGSVNKNGPASATYTIHPLPYQNTLANLSGFAAAILAANSTPQRAVRSFVLPVLTDQQRRHAIRIDIADIVGVMRSGLLAMANHRVTGIEHRIVVGAGGDRALNAWTTTYTFDPATVAQVPTISPGADPGTGSGTQPWTAPTLVNSWSVAGAATGYRLFGDRVAMQGRVSNPGAVTASVICTLPAGYRPTQIQTFVVYAGTSGNGFGVVTVNTNGDVRWESPGSGGSTATVVLDSISFAIN